MKKATLAIVLTALAIFLIPFAAWLFWLGTEQNGLARIQAKMWAEGLPMTATDLFPAVSAAEENAAPLLREAYVEIEKLPKGSPLLDRRPGSAIEKSDTARCPQAERDRMKAAFAEPPAGAAISLLRQAANKEKCWFDRDYSKGPGLVLPDLGNVLKASKLLLNHAFLLAADGDSAGATRDIRAVLRIARFYSEDPALISWLVGEANAGVCFPAITAVAATGRGLTPDEAKALEGAVKGRLALMRPSLLRALDGERIFFGSWIFEQLLSSNPAAAAALMGGGSSKSALFSRIGFWLYSVPLRPLLLADYSAYLRSMREVRRLVADPLAGGPGLKTILANIPRTAFLTRLAMPAYDGVLNRFNVDEAACHLAILGLRAEKFRLTSGRYPRDLLELARGGRLPPDPFTGRDFVYRESGGDILIYSVGSDGVNNAGNPKRENGQSDIVWTVRRSAAGAGN